MEHSHNCQCGHNHPHEHEGWEERAEEFSKINADKYHEAFGKYDLQGSDAAVSLEVKKLLEEHAEENFTPDVLKEIHGFIDLTSLTSLDTKESIWNLTEAVNDFEGTRPDVPNVSSICVYPLFV